MPTSGTKNCDIKTLVLKTGFENQCEVQKNKIKSTFSSHENIIIMRLTLIAIWICVLAKPSLQSDLLKYLWNPIKYSIGMIVDPIRYVIFFTTDLGSLNETLKMWKYKNFLAT